jgi:hypothetical protein
VDARVLEIGGRRAPFEFYPSVRANFALSEGDTVPASTVLAPAVDLYCLDDRKGRALFAEMPDGVDPATAPFFYLEQYRRPSGCWRCRTRPCTSWPRPCRTRS